MSTDTHEEQRLRRMLHRTAGDLVPDPDLVARVRRRVRRRRVARWATVPVAAALGVALGFVLAPSGGPGGSTHLIRLAGYQTAQPVGVSGTLTASGTSTVGLRACLGPGVDNIWIGPAAPERSGNLSSAGGAVLRDTRGLHFYTPHHPKKRVSSIEKTPRFGVVSSNYVITTDGRPGCVWSFLTSAYPKPAAGDPVVPVGARHTVVAGHQAWTLGREVLVQLPVAGAHGDAQTLVMGSSTPDVQRHQVLGIMRDTLRNPGGVVGRVP